MSRAGSLAGVCLAGGLLLVAARAEAYVVGTYGGHELKWASPNVTYRVNTAGGPTGALAGVQAAFGTWNDVGTASINFAYGGSTAKTYANYGDYDGENIVVFGTMSNSGIVAQNSYTFYTDTGEVVDSDIVYNLQHAWATDGSAGKFDVWNIGAHELGHSLVLADLYNAGDSLKTMYGYANTGETKKRTLDADDIAGVSHLYPELNPPPGAFSKSAPANGATGQATGLTLTWAASTGASSYEYCYDTTIGSVCDGSWTSTGTSTSVALSSLAPGTTYFWQVRAVNANGPTYANGGAWWGFTVMSAPGAFVKRTPVDGATGQAAAPTLQWGASTDAAGYEYCYDLTNDAACGGSWVSVGAATSSALAGLTPGATYFWQVRATNVLGTTYASGGAWWSFTVVPLPGAFAKTAPANGSAGPLSGRTLQWGASTDAASYEYCYDTTDDDACGGAWIANGSATSAALGTLAPATYFWQARAVNGSGTRYADGGAWRAFTAVAPPGAFAKAAPANVATGVAAAPTLSWGASAGATAYEYCYDTTNDGACGGSWTDAGAATSVPLAGLAGSTTYFWQVRAKNPGGTVNADGGTWWRFTTVVEPPGAFAKVAPAPGAAGVSVTPNLQWEASAGATAYEYCCDTTDDDACGGPWVSAGTSTSVAVGPLAPGTTHFWQVRATNAGGTTEAGGGSWGSFTTVAGGEGWVFAWEDDFDGPAAADDAGYDVAVDAAGNAHVVGSTWAGDLQRENVLLRSYAPGGTLLLDVTHDAGNWAQDVGRGVAVDPGDGSIYVAGWTSAYRQGKNVLLLKYSAAGVLEWERTYDGWSGMHDLGFGVAVGADGSVYVAGTTVVTGRSYDVFLRKYSSGGDPLWTQVFDGGARGIDVAYRVRVAGGLVVVAGATQVVGQGYDAALWAFGLDGAFQGSRTFDGEGHGDDFAYGLDVSAGMIVLGGATAVAGRGLDTLGLLYDLDGTFAGRLAFGSDTTGDDVAFGIAHSAVDATVYVVGSGGNALPWTGRAIAIDGDRSAFLAGEGPSPGAGNNLFLQRYQYVTP